MYTCEWQTGVTDQLSLLRPLACALDLEVVPVLGQQRVQAQHRASRARDAVTRHGLTKTQHQEKEEESQVRAR